MAGTVCVACRHRKADRGQVCTTCWGRIVDQLTDLPRKLRALTLQLVPSPTGLQPDRVTHVRTEAPIPVRMDALTLAGPGGDGLSPQAVAAMMHPAVRRWTTETTVTVTVPAGADGLTRDEERTLTEWHQEVARDDDGQVVVVVDDDQVGILPPVEWLDLWVRHWRAHFGHHVPHQPPTPGAGRRLAGDSRNLHGRAARERVAATVLGLVPGYAGALPAEHRPDDPLEAEWEVRFGRQRNGWWPATDVAYLLTFLDAACDQDVGIAAFATELRALDAELTRVLGELPDQQWIGRCPATLTDHGDGEPRPCGTGLWQDPHASQIMCPRCRSTWGPRRIELFHLAEAIRKVWPLDRRRRYTLAETLQVPVLHCAMCASELVVAWVDVTAVGDTERWWRPDRVVCPMGCANIGRFL